MFRSFFNSMQSRVWPHLVEQKIAYLFFAFSLQFIFIALASVTSHTTLHTLPFQRRDYHYVRVVQLKAAFGPWTYFLRFVNFLTIDVMSCVCDSRHF